MLKAKTLMQEPILEVVLETLEVLKISSEEEVVDNTLSFISEVEVVVVKSVKGFLKKKRKKKRSFLKIILILL